MQDILEDFDQIWPECISEMEALKDCISFHNRKIYLVSSASAVKASYELHIILQYGNRFSFCPDASASKGYVEGDNVVITASRVA